MRPVSMAVAKAAHEKEYLINYPQALISLTDFERDFAGQRIFTRSLLEQAASDVDQARRDEDTPIVVEGVRGDFYEIWPYGGVSSYGAHLAWKKYSDFALAQPTAYLIVPNLNIGSVTQTDTLGPGENAAWSRAKRTREPREMGRIRQMEQEWLASAQWAQMKKSLAALAGKAQVKNIVCIAMGPMFSFDYSKTNGTGDTFCRERAHQHLLAGCIARFLRSQYAAKDPNAPAIDVYAYDPDYTPKDMVAFEHFPLPITMLSDPHHYLAITPHTLVISASCPAFVPNHEIIADLLYPSGPAAILSNEVWAHPWHKEEKVALLDVWTPRVGKMMEMYEQEDMERLGWDDIELGYGDTKHPWAWLNPMVLYSRDDA
ncbi:hypothetical protein BU26DRAFT_563616 [Trematosphaeria pertusa]|uniref:SRR1-like domain-containing protein n=1 Tax=Trematosphaeria pertusa TaxID=390896 RepID=A0A6A6IHP9_9PLEO|nr:uncharacterized protein BU26DRAFT_563616 [Trematosphaeria pertusa]KAF2249719.1 hypothetical protein BU26DRAFT_563616 [Trematosphaeria pertusa]